MSIYPVPLQEWFPHPKSRLRYGEFWDAMISHETCKLIVETTKCKGCGKSCKWNRAWGHHSIPWGYGSVFCSADCLFSKKKRKKKIRVNRWKRIKSARISKILSQMSEEKISF